MITLSAFRILNHAHRTARVWLIALVLIGIGCSGSRVGHQARTVAEVKSQQQDLRILDSPIKVFRIDGTIVLFRKGASVADTAIWGTADVMSPKGVLDTSVTITLTASEIAGATLYDFKQSAGSVVGAGLTGIFGTYSWIMALVCLSDPKACFGSCPTVYVPHGDSMLMVAELFSTSISPSLARSDIDRLCTVDGDTHFPVMITNEALESHYIDKVQFVYVPHEPDETALPQPDGSIVIGSRSTLELSARSSLDKDLTPVLYAPDTRSWRSGPERLLTAPSDDPFDHVDITTYAPGLTAVDLRMRWKNTLLSTVLFYNIVLGDQGLHALFWQHQLDTDPLYALAFSRIYDQYSGIGLQVWDGEQWRNEARMTDAGPIVWHEGSVRLSTYGQDTVRIRLRGLADNVEIDAVELSAPQQCAALEIPMPWYVHSTTEQNDPRIGQVLSAADGEYLMHEPSASTTLMLQPPSGARHGTVFVRSHGWYYEWIRQQWIAPNTRKKSEYLMNGEEMIRALAKRWMDEHAALEASFHQSTIPLRKP